VFDYAYPRVAQAGPANTVIATASTATNTYTSQPPHGTVAAELAEVDALRGLLVVGVDHGERAKHRQARQNVAGEAVQARAAVRVHGGWQPRLRQDQRRGAREHALGIRREPRPKQQSGEHRHGLDA
jgi:hypothetical protein